MKICFIVFLVNINLPKSALFSMHNYQTFDALKSGFKLDSYIWYIFILYLVLTWVWIPGSVQVHGSSSVRDQVRAPQPDEGVHQEPVISCIDRNLFNFGTFEVYCLMNQTLIDLCQFIFLWYSFWFYKNLNLYLIILILFWWIQLSWLIDRPHHLCLIIYVEVYFKIQFCLLDG